MNRHRVFGMIACIGLVAPFAMGQQDAKEAGCTDCGSAEPCTSCSTEGVAAAGSDTFNTTCPYSGKPVDPSAKTVSYNGKKIGFCCSDCAGKFEGERAFKKNKIFGELVEASMKTHVGDDKPINAMCPVGKEAVDPGTATTSYKGKTIGFCCGGCREKFEAWDDAKKDAFVAEAAMGSGMKSHKGKKKMDGMKKVSSWTGPYTLNTCPVSGQALGGMGDPIIKVIDGREVRLCCKKCVGKFEANKDKYFKKIDMQIMHDQMRYYPVQTCVISGEPLVEDGEDISRNFVYGNRLIRTCCKKCERKFRADPAAYIKDLDKAVADAQRDSYPLKTCLISGGELGGMGEPVEIVVAGRLIRLCCAMCEPKVMANPAKYIGEIDAAWQEQGQFMPKKGEHGEGHGGDHGDHGGHGDHGDHGG